MSKVIICATCGYIGGAKTAAKGSGCLELLLWCLFIVPGLIYSVWRITNKPKICPKCQSTTLIPEDSPKGKEILAKAENQRLLEKAVQDKKSETKRASILIAIIVGFFLIMILSVAFSDTTSNIPTSTPMEATPPTTGDVAEPAFDVPLLLGKNIDQIRTSLGQPTDKNIEAPANTLAKQATLGKSMDTWSNTFESKGMKMSVEYYIKNRTVKDFFIEANDPSGATADKQVLMKIGNLKENDPRYLLRFVEAKTLPGKYTGLTITKK